MKMNIEKQAHPLAVPFFSLASPEGGEGRGEEAKAFRDQIPSPRPSPRLGGERESGTGYPPQCPTRPRAGWIGRWKLNVKCSTFLSAVLLFLAAFTLRGQTSTSEDQCATEIIAAIWRTAANFFGTARNFHGGCRTRDHRAGSVRILADFSSQDKNDHSARSASPAGIGNIARTTRGRRDVESYLASITKLFHDGV